MNTIDSLGLCPDDPLPKDPAFKNLIDAVWLKSTPLGLSGVGWFGAFEHYGFLQSINGINTTSGPFKTTTPMTGFQAAHVNSDPAGTIAGAHAHWTNNKNPSPGDKNVAITRNRPEYIITKDGLTRIDPDGTIHQLDRDGTSRCKCPKK